MIDLKQHEIIILPNKPFTFKSFRPSNCSQGFKNMDITMKRKFKTSALVALIIALLFPAMWFIFTGSTTRTPIMEKGYIESMSYPDREKWLQDNSSPVSLFEHAKSTPRFIVNNWQGYIQTSIGAFVVVFVLNGAFIFGGRRNEP